MPEAVSPQARVFESVTEYLSWDHDRLEGLLAEAASSVDAGLFDTALARYAEFELGLMRHIRLEENLLFPVFEACTGIGDGPTAVMRAEHKQIVKAVGMMACGLEANDPEAFRRGLRYMRESMRDHNSKEEHVLYPTMDAALNGRERTALVERLLRE